MPPPARWPRHSNKQFGTFARRRRDPSAVALSGFGCDPQCLRPQPRTLRSRRIPQISDSPREQPRYTAHQAYGGRRVSRGVLRNEECHPVEGATANHRLCETDMDLVAHLVSQKSQQLIDAVPVHLHHWLIERGLPFHEGCTERSRVRCAPARPSVAAAEKRNRSGEPTGDVQGTNAVGPQRLDKSLEDLYTALRCDVLEGDSSECTKSNVPVTRESVSSLCKSFDIGEAPFDDVLSASSDEH